MRRRRAGSPHRLTIALADPGREHRLVAHVFDSGRPGPRICLQAGLHGGEHAGIYLLTRLAHRLLATPGLRPVRGSLVILPLANPFGPHQMLLGEQAGRYALADGRNFNRGFQTAVPLAAELLPAIAEGLGGGRRMLRLAAEGGRSVLPLWRAALLALGASCDLVVDLHCDGESVLHAYAPARHPLLESLFRHLGVALVLEGTDGEAGAFEETLVLEASHIPGARRPLATTVELRGRADVGGAAARRDEAALLAFLAKEGMIAARAEPPVGEAPIWRPLSHVAYVAMPAAGVVDYRAAPGSRIAAGAPLATLARLDARGRPLLEAVTAPADGLMFARHHRRFLHAGEIVAKIAAETPRAGPGPLLPA